MLIFLFNIYICENKSCAFLSCTTEDDRFVAPEGSGIFRVIETFKKKKKCFKFANFIALKWL
jgi:hypothetical protein